MGMKKLFLWILFIRSEGLIPRPSGALIKVLNPSSTTFKNQHTPLLAAGLLILFFFGCSTNQKSASNFSINFVVDKKWDTEYIYIMFRPNEPAGLANRASMMGIDYELAKMIQDAKDYSEVKSNLESLVDNRYRQIGNGLRKSANDYSTAWESCIKEFTDVVTELTQHGWFYNSYTCVVSAFHLGLSNWYGNTIIRHYGEDPVKQRYVTAFEIVLSHVFHISRKYFDRNEAEDHIIWAISEISALLILEDNRLMRLWDNNYFDTIGYTQLKELEKKLRIAYWENADFTSYLRSAVQLAKEMNMDFTIPVQPERPTASFLLLASVPEDVRQLTPTAMGRSNIIDNCLSVDLVEPINYQDRGGWWAFGNKAWVGKGEYYILYVPLGWNDNGTFSWILNEAQIYVGSGSIPIMYEIDSTSISFSLDQFRKAF